MASVSIEARGQKKQLAINAVKEFCVLELHKINLTTLSSGGPKDV
jgi:hypothetical protein